MHTTVLLKEAVEGLNLNEGDIVVDATLGVGGHAISLAKKVGEKGRVIAFDLDGEAIAEFERRIEKEGFNRDNFLLIRGNFAEIGKLLPANGIERIDAVLADLGWRIEQVEDASYGMSFLRNGPLDMRLGKEGDVTAADIINKWSEYDLAEMFFRNSQEKGSRIIAKKIVEHRKEGRIENTLSLAQLAERVLKPLYRKSKIHPATKIFQALRMEVNQELANLESLIRSSIEMLRPKGRLAIISFHSLEDKLVKRLYQEYSRGCVCPKGIPVCVCGRKPITRIVNKRALMPSEKEKTENSRSRSAKLRILEKNNF